MIIEKIELKWNLPNRTEWNLWNDHNKQFFLPDSESET